MSLEADSLITSIDNIFKINSAGSGIFRPRSLQEYLSQEQESVEDDEVVIESTLCKLEFIVPQLKRLTYSANSGLSNWVDLRGVKTIKAGLGIVDFPDVKRAEKHVFTPEKIALSILIADFIGEKQGIAKAFYPEQYPRDKVDHFVPLIMGMKDAERLLRFGFRGMGLPEERLPSLLDRCLNSIRTSNDPAVVSLYDRWIIPSLSSELCRGRGNEA